MNILSVNLLGFFFQWINQWFVTKSWKRQNTKEVVVLCQDLRDMATQSIQPDKTNEDVWKAATLGRRMRRGSISLAVRHVSSGGLFGWSHLLIRESDQIESFCMKTPLHSLTVTFLLSAFTANSYMLAITWCCSVWDVGTYWSLRLLLEGYCCWRNS